MEEQEICDFADVLLGASRVTNRGFYQVYGVLKDNSGHFFRVPILALYLGLLEKLKKEDLLAVTVVALFHDIHEAFMGDLSFVDRQFFDEKSFKKAKERALEKTLSYLPKELRDFIKSCLDRVYNNEKLKTIVKDADMLDYILQGKDLMNVGIKDAYTHVRNAFFLIKGEKAKEIGKTLMEKWKVNYLWMRLQTPDVLKKNGKLFEDD